MLERIKTLSQTAMALAVAVFFAYSTYLLYRAPNILLHANGVLTRFEGVESKANAVLSNADKASKVWAESAQEQSRDIHALTQDARGTLGALRGAAESAQGTITTIGEQAASVGPAVESVKVLASAGAEDLRQLKPTIIGSTNTIEDLRAFLKRDSTHLDSILGNVDQISTSSVAIMNDFQKAADKATADYLKPTKWYMQPVKRFGEAWDIGAAVARHTP